MFCSRIWNNLIKLTHANWRQMLKDHVNCFVEVLRKNNDTLIFFYKHNNYKHTYGKKCEKISIILSIMLR